MHLNKNWTSEIYSTMNKWPRNLVRKDRSLIMPLDMDSLTLKHIAFSYNILCSSLYRCRPELISNRLNSGLNRRMQISNMFSTNNEFYKYVVSRQQYGML